MTQSEYLERLQFSHKKLIVVCQQLIEMIYHGATTPEIDKELKQAEELLKTARSIKE